MSSVRFVFPKLKLTGQLKAAGGRPVVEALAAAKANLAAIQPECLSALQALTEEALGCLQRFPSTFNSESLKELYVIASRGVGVGAVSGSPAADTALVSLCDLLDHLRVTGRWDREAITVHVKTLQLLVLGAGQNMDAATADAILSGLRKVTALYAARPAAAAG
jgi:hypothetical protein